MTVSSENFVMRSIRIVPFSRSQEYWFKWKSKFIVADRLNKYYKMMEVTDDIPDEILKNRDHSKAIPPLYGALLKNEQDVHLLERLAFMHRRETR